MTMLSRIDDSGGSTELDRTAHGPRSPLVASLAVHMSIDVGRLLILTPHELSMIAFSSPDSVLSLESGRSLVNCSKNLSKVCNEGEMEVPWVSYQA